MAELKIEAKNVQMSDANTLHVDFYPKNVGVQEMVMHGAELDISSCTPEEAIVNYEPIAKAELLKYLEGQFPGVFT